MTPTVVAKVDTCRHDLLSARAFFGESRFSVKRVARDAAFVFLVGCLLSVTPGPQLFLILPLLLEWSRVASARRNADPYQYLEALAKASPLVETKQIEEAKDCCKEHYLRFSRFSPRRVLFNGGMLLGLLHYTPVDDLFDVSFSSHPFTMLASTAVLYFGIPTAVELVRTAKLRSRVNPVQFMGEEVS